MAYNLIGHEESVAPVITPPANSPQPSPASSLRRGRFGRFKHTVTSTLRRRTNPTREEVMKTLPTFWPVMTIIIAIVEVAMLVATIITGGLAPISFVPKTVIGPVVGFDNISDSGYREVVPNFFIGTSKAALIHTGAMYTPVSKQLNQDPKNEGHF